LGGVKMISTTMHKMIACRCVIRTHTSEESQDDSMPMCHSNSHEWRVTR
jgi:hypothetical protein